VKQVVIENPVLNSAFAEPERHWKFGDEGITDEIVEARRISAYFVPVAQPKRRGKDKQLVLDTEWTASRKKENTEINQIRGRVLVVEYKGEHLIGGPDTDEKRSIGEIWAARSSGRCIFMLVGKVDYKSEIRNAVKGS